MAFHIISQMPEAASVNISWSELQELDVARRDRLVEYLEKANDALRQAHTRARSGMRG